MQSSNRSRVRQCRGGWLGRLAAATAWVGLCLAAVGAHVPIALGQQSEEAQAEPSERDEQKARAAFERGRIHYENGDFEQAAEAFDEAYRLSGKPDLLYNLYVARRDANQQEAAAEALRGYLEMASVVENRPQLEARLEALEAGIAKREAERIAAEQAAEQESEVEQVPEPEPETQPSEPPPEAEARWWLYPTVMLAAGGGLMVASIPTGVLARGKAQDLEDQCAGGSCDPDLKSTQDSGRTMAIVTDALLFGGAAVAVAGAVWMILKRPDEQAEARRVRPSVACGPGACGGSLTVDF